MWFIYNWLVLHISYGCSLPMLPLCMWKTDHVVGMRTFFALFHWEISCNLYLYNSWNTQWHIVLWDNLFQCMTALLGYTTEQLHFFNKIFDSSVRAYQSVQWSTLSVCSVIYSKATYVLACTFFAWNLLANCYTILQR